jgi:hypothetical protein
MQKPTTLIGQCAKGHDVYATHDMNGDVDGGLIGADAVAPLPDGKSSAPIAVACQECVNLLDKHIKARNP